MTPRTVQKVEFVPERAVRARFGGEGTGLPDDTLLCLVTVQGTFSVSGPPLSGSTPKTVVSHLMFQVFDAHTGNLLMQVMGPNS